MAVKITKGDCYWEDFDSTSVANLDSAWVGTWGIVKSLGTLPIISGPLNKSVDLKKFQLRILPEHTSPLAVGNYILVVQITNTTVGFNKEVAHRSITITEQGLT